MAIPRLLDSLLRAHGPSGHEQLAYDAVRSALADTMEVTTDAMGNLIARRAGETEAPTLAVFAHLDVAGMAVSHIADDGVVSIHALAPSHASVAYGQRVEIRTAHGDVPGVVALRSTGTEKIEWGSLYIDIGARTGAEARDLVAPGDPVVAIAPPLELAGGRIASRSLDNRAGVYVALEAYRRLDGERIAVAATTNEELGGLGAQVAAHALRPDVALALDVTYATDVPSGEVHEAGAHQLGGGPAIFRGPTIHPRVFELLIEAAQAAGIGYTVETGSKTATDADSVFASRDGIPTGVISIPLRNMHSPIEIVELADLEACIELVVAFAKLLEPGASYAR